MRLAGVVLLALATSAGAGELRVIDGDTIELAGERIRLVGFDTPEIGHARCPAEADRGRAARDALAGVLMSGALTIERRGRDRYRRTLAIVRVDGQDVATIMLAAGHGRP